MRISIEMGLILTHAVPTRLIQRMLRDCRAPPGRPILQRQAVRGLPQLRTDDHASPKFEIL